MGNGNRRDGAEATERREREECKRVRGLEDAALRMARELQSRDRTADRALGKSEREERTRIYQHPDGIAFGFGKRQPASGEVERWFKGLSDRERNLLRTPGARVSLFGHASRVGSSEYNDKLSEDRADAVEKILKERYSIVADIETVALGESRKGDRPDGRDDSRDRWVEVHIRGPEIAVRDQLKKGDRSKAVKSLESLAHPPLDSHLREQWEMAKKTAGDALRDIAKDVGKGIPPDIAVEKALLKHAAKHAAKEMRWFVEKAFEDVRENKVIGRIIPNVTCGISDQLADLTGARKSGYKVESYYRSDRLYEAGRQMTRDWWDQLADEERDNLKRVMGDRADRVRFEQPLREIVGVSIATRGARHVPKTR